MDKIMKTCLIAAKFLFFGIIFGCGNQGRVNEPKYGNNDNEFTPGSWLNSHINVENIGGGIPWHSKVTDDKYMWYKCIINFQKLLTIRNAPVTNHVKVAVCKMENSDEFCWVYNEVWEDGLVYKRLILSNGLYEIALKKSENKWILGSIKKSAQQGDAPGPACRPGDPRRWADPK